MPRTVLFDMWEPFRLSLIQRHRFYFEQAQSRLLSQFKNLEAEAKEVEQIYLGEMGKHFDPDRHSPEDFLQAAYDKSCEHYQLLGELLKDTRLSVSAGMFHEWEKQLREWVTKEARHWGGNEHADSAVWRVPITEVIDLLVCMGWDVRGEGFYSSLNGLRLVVNVFKHGNGSSLLELQTKYPEYVPNPLADLGLVSMNGEWRAHYRNLQLNDGHLRDFSQAIIQFWEAVPGRIYINDGDELSVPAWFKSAYLKDAVN